MSSVVLIGQGIRYSASPAMHSAAFAALGLDHRYELVDVERDDLPDAVAALRDAEVLGANVTVPHKAAVMPLLDEIDALAQRAEAVNTIVRRDGRLVGSNTDIPSLADEMRLLAGNPRSAVILGAGGAARGAAIALAELGATDVVAVSRAMWSRVPELVRSADLLVNASPIGTNSDESPIDPAFFHRGLAVLDLVYRPSPTRLVHDARACGLEAHAGAGVLLGQGWRSLEDWLGIEVSLGVKRVMADALAAELGAGADV